MVADSQIHRFLILHKELDPDDDELTRTRKVRRGFIAEKYAVLIDALYAGKASQFIETAGQVRGWPHGHDQRRREDPTVPRPIRACDSGVKRSPTMHSDRARHEPAGTARRRIGDVLLDLENISLRSAASRR